MFALGFLLFTLMLKVAVPITLGEFEAVAAPDEHAAVPAFSAGSAKHAEV